MTNDTSPPPMTTRSEVLRKLQELGGDISPETLKVLEYNPDEPMIAPLVSPAGSPFDPNEERRPVSLEPVNLYNPTPAPLTPTRNPPGKLPTTTRSLSIPITPTEVFRALTAITNVNVALGNRNDISRAWNTALSKFNLANKTDYPRKWFKTKVEEILTFNENQRPESNERLTKLFESLDESSSALIDKACAQRVQGDRAREQQVIDRQKAKDQENIGKAMRAASMVTMGRRQVNDVADSLANGTYTPSDNKPLDPNIDPCLQGPSTPTQSPTAVPDRPSTPTGSRPFGDDVSNTPTKPRPSTKNATPLASRKRARTDENDGWQDGREKGKKQKKSDYDGLGESLQAMVSENSESGQRIIELLEKANDIEEKKLKLNEKLLEKF